MAIKKILIVVDMQNDFVYGSLGSEQAQKIVPNVVNKIKQYDNKKSLIVFTRDTHMDNYLETSEGKHLPVPHCIKDTPGHSLIPELNNMEIKNANVFIHDKLSFGSTSLPLQIIVNSGYKMNQFPKDVEIEIIGVCTSICVVSNALILKAAFPECPMKVDPTCCACISEESHQNALNTMGMCQIKIV